MTHQLQNGACTPICYGVILSRLFALCLALSLLFGPLAMDRAMAAAPASSHSQKMMDDGHCQPADDETTDPAKSKPCCAAMCAAVVVVPGASVSQLRFARLSAIAAPAGFRSGILSEISTPPPRPS